MWLLFYSRSLMSGWTEANVCASVWVDVQIHWWRLKNNVEHYKQICLFVINNYDFHQQRNSSDSEANRGQCVPALTMCKIALWIILQKCVRSFISFIQWMLTEGEITQMIKRALNIRSNYITDKTNQNQPVFAIFLKTHSERYMAYVYIFFLVI